MTKTGISYLNVLTKASLFMASLGLFLIFPVSSLATDCPLIPQTAYKSPDSSAVYYITRTCTKRPFTSEPAFFAYFSSWKQVKKTSTSLLGSIPMDPRGAMSYRSSDTVPTLPVTPKPTPVVIPPVTTPISEAPAAPTQPTPTPVVTAPTPITTQPTTPTPPSPLIPQFNSNQTLTGVMADYLRCPTQADRDQIDHDFNLVWDKTWENNPFVCDYHTTNPSRLNIYSTLRAVKTIQFQKPLPFTGNRSLYEFLTSAKLTLNPSTDCTMQSNGWNYVVNLGGSFAHTHAIKSGAANCTYAYNGRNESLDDFVYNPLTRIGLLVHEAHHAITGSVHPVNSANDKSIDDNSAWAAQFYFYAWIKLYSTNIDANTKELARISAITILRERFSDNHCPQNSELAAVVNQILPGTCN